MTRPANSLSLRERECVRPREREREEEIERERSVLPYRIYYCISERKKRPRSELRGRGEKGREERERERREGRGSCVPLQSFELCLFVRSVESVFFLWNDSWSAALPAAQAVPSQQQLLASAATKHMIKFWKTWKQKIRSQFLADFSSFRNRTGLEPTTSRPGGFVRRKPDGPWQKVSV